MRSHGGGFLPPARGGANGSGGVLLTGVEEPKIVRPIDPRHFIRPFDSFVEEPPRDIPDQHRQLRFQWSVFVARFQHEMFYRLPEELPCESPT